VSDCVRNRRGDVGQRSAISSKLAGTATLDDVLWATAYQIALDAESARGCAVAGGRCPDREGGLSAGKDQLDKADLAARTGPGATTARPGRGSDTLPAAPSGCFSRCGPARADRAIGIDSDKTGPL